MIEDRMPKAMFETGIELKDQQLKEEIMSILHSNLVLPEKVEHITYLLARQPGKDISGFEGSKNIVFVWNDLYLQARNYEDYFELFEFFDDYREAFEEAHLHIYRVIDKLIGMPVPQDFNPARLLKVMEYLDSTADTHRLQDLAKRYTMESKGRHLYREVVLKPLNWHYFSYDDKLLMLRQITFDCDPEEYEDHRIMDFLLGGQDTYT